MKTRRYCVPQLLTSMVAMAAVSCYAQHMNAKDSPCQNPSSSAEEAGCFSAATPMPKNCRPERVTSRSSRSLS